MLKRQDKHKIVFQFTNANDTIQQKAFTNQLNNLTTHWPKAKYEVVVYNMGLEYLMLTKSKHIAAIKALHAKGVRFVVCENTMKSRKITKEQLIPEGNMCPPALLKLLKTRTRLELYKRRVLINSYLTFII
jgi:intracellular sulfur oxidation DsrE/DsrF family protein